MKINAADVRRHNGQIQLGAVIEYANQRKYLWYSVPEQYEGYLTTEKMDGFLVALLPLAMMTGEDIHIDGAISQKLLYNLTEYYMRILGSMIPSLRPVSIVPAHLDSGCSYQSRNGVVTGFSGGIDSFCVVRDHLRNDIPNAYRLTHLALNNVGAFGKRGTELFHDRFRELSGFASESQIPFVKIDSNVDSILPREIDYVRVTVTRNVSAILVLQKLFGKYLYASSDKYEDCFVGPTDDSAYSDPFAVHLLSTETLECISTGCQYSRVEKTIRVSDFEPSWRYLTVCARNRGIGNCSTCFKCARTLLTLEILGKEDLYDSVFDLDAYRRIRKRFIAKVLLSRECLLREVAQFAKVRGFEFSVFQRALRLVPKGLLTWLVPGFLRRRIMRLLGGPDYPQNTGYR